MLAKITTRGQTGDDGGDGVVPTSPFLFHNTYQLCAYVWTTTRKTARQHAS